MNTLLLSLFVSVLILVVILFLIMITSTDSKTFVSESSDINNYKYASISSSQNCSSLAHLMNIDMTVYDVLESAGFTMIGENVIDNLTEEQKGKLFLVKFSASSNLVESVVTINFIDYLKGKSIVNYRGASCDGFGSSRQADMNKAIKRAITQLSEFLMNNKK